MNAFAGDRDAYRKANPHVHPIELRPIGHECWDCENAFATYWRVRHGVPYWVLKHFSKYFRNAK